MKQWIVWLAIAAVSITLSGCARAKKTEEPLPDAKSKIELPIEWENIGEPGVLTPMVPYEPIVPVTPMPDPFQAEWTPPIRSNTPIDPDEPIIPVIPQPPST